ncbi:TIGR02285 family protein [uncultured Desulfosarcina sp.]|uniref:TIGR02285 family protein n=1 Tax=uncultured Desulfosarcina sp. TaxID=218289 RepID=UPI0029C82CE6|nr:TIGR02285 family protein [uncultured Desulfosarcina sp.]
MVGAEEEIIWIKRHFPPAFILEGDLAGQGIHDRTMEILQKGLPEYRHQIVTANHPRTKKMMETDANICRVGLFRNEARERTMHMSVAHILVPPLRIYMKTSLLPSIRPIMEKDGHHCVSLERLIRSRSDLILGIEAERSYGGAIDEILNRYRNRTNVSVRYSSDTKGHTQMLLRGRIDYLIEFPPIFLYGLQERQTILKDLCSLEIGESRTFQPACVGCSKTESGKTIINRIDAILLKERKTESFRQTIERWLDADTVRSFREAYDKAFFSQSP